MTSSTVQTKQTVAMTPASADALAQGRQYRSRRNRPCDACRKKKLRCFIEPNERICTLCRVQGIECTFVEKPVKRKRPPPTIESSPPVESGKTESHSPVQRRNSEDMGSRSETSAEKHAPPPPAADGSLVMYNGHTTQWVGPSGDLDPALLKTRSTYHNGGMDVLAETSIRHISGDPNDPIHFNVVPDHDSDTEARPTRKDFTWKDVFDHCQPYTKRLVDLYFRIVNPTFPIVNQTRFIQYVDGGGLASTPGTTLASIVVLASNWWSFDSGLCRHTCPDMKPLRDYLRRALLSETRTPRLVTIQALLIYFSTTLSSPLQKRDPTASSSELWAWTGSLVATAQTLGLHQSPLHWRIPKWEIRVRKRLWWAVFIHDKWTAHSLGRPSHINTNDWNVPPLIPSDFADDDRSDGHESPFDHLPETEKAAKTAGMELFMNMSNLTTILSDVLEFLYSTRTIKILMQSTTTSMNLVNPLSQQLKAWHEALPRSLSIDEIDEGILNSNGSLHLAFYTVKISLHRAIMRSIQEGENGSHLALASRADAKTTASSVLQFIKKLTPEHMQAYFYSFSPVNFSIAGTFLAALLFTSREEAEFYALQKLVEKYRWTLRIHSRSSSGLTDLALHRLDSLLSNSVSPPTSRISIPVADASIQTGFAHESPRTELPKTSPLATNHDPLGVALRSAWGNEGEPGLPILEGFDFDFERWMRDPYIFEVDGLLQAEGIGMDLDFPTEFSQFDHGPGF